MKKTGAIAIIPARFSSKRILNKNIKKFFNYPIIYYTIKVALDSGCFDNVYVSTDSEKIAKISKKYGAKVPFIRSKSLSGDYTETVPVICDAINKIKKIEDFNYVCCLYPASPFIKKNNVKKAFKLSKKINNLVFPVSKFETPIDRNISINKKKKIIFNKNKFFKRTQDLEQYFYDAGQFYFAPKNLFFNKKIINKDCSVIILNKFESIDINDPEDWKVAEKIYKIKKL
jgi:pseudaminic acid cytidylyltransferase